MTPEAAMAFIAAGPAPFVYSLQEGARDGNFEKDE